MEIAADALPEAAALDAYEVTAPYYDAFTAEHDYELWLGNLLPEIRARGLRGSRLLDVGCGTGKSFLPLLEAGWEVTAVDISPAMVARAREKARGRARVSVADMRRLPVLGQFDLAWCLDDAINYLLEPRELELCLSGLARNLVAGGLCVFDVNTLRSYREFFASTAVVEDADRRLTWRGRASSRTAPGDVVRAELEIEAGSGAPRAVAVHRQRHFRRSELERALERAGLRLLAVFGHGYDARLERPLDERRHTKAIYIARRERR
jgi:SAM-dependent methyltransferase